jgi:hypothetical protein
VVLKAPLAARGYSVQLNGVGGSAKIFLSTRNHTNVDVFFWRVRRGSELFRVRYARVDDCKGREFTRDYIEPLAEVEWEGMKLKAPNNAERFLEMRYGPNWRTPIAANNDGVRR